MEEKKLCKKGKNELSLVVLCSILRDRMFNLSSLIVVVLKNRNNIKIEWEKKYLVLECFKTISTL